MSSIHPPAGSDQIEATSQEIVLGPAAGVGRGQRFLWCGSGPSPAHRRCHHAGGQPA